MKSFSTLTLGAFVVAASCFYGPPVSTPTPVMQPSYTSPEPTSPTPNPYGNNNQPAPVLTGGKAVSVYPKVIMTIPEYHINNVRVNDPAAETEFMKTFIGQGYKVIDKKQAEKVWKDDVLYKLEKEEDITAAAALAFKAGAEVLVIGEAFSEKGVATSTYSSGIYTNLYSCAGRVSVKVIKASNGQILYTDSVTSKSVDTTEVIAGKNAVAKAAAELSQRASVQLLKVWNDDTFGGGATIEVIVSIPNQNLTFGEADSFRKAAVKAIPGVKEVLMREFIEGAAPYEFVYAGDAQGLASAMNGQTINGRTCTVTKVQNGKIFVNLK
jgi:hypothetical protein